MTTSVLNTKLAAQYKKKTDYETKIGEIEMKITDHDHFKYITTQKFNNLMVEDFKERLKKANNLVIKTDLIINS